MSTRIGSRRARRSQTTAPASRAQRQRSGARQRGGVARRRSNPIDAVSTLLNLSRATGVDPDLEDSAAWNRVAAPAVETLWPLYGNGCVFGATADEWVPVRLPVPRLHWI